MTPEPEQFMKIRPGFPHSPLIRGLVVATMLSAAHDAFAHAHPKHMAPAANATVPASTNEVAIDFDEGLEPAFSSIAVTGADGKSVMHAKSRVDPANDKHMSVVLDPLTPGVYTVAWVAIALDGHRTQGRYTFTVK